MEFINRFLCILKLLRNILHIFEILRYAFRTSKLGISCQIQISSFASLIKNLSPTINLATRLCCMSTHSLINLLPSNNNQHFRFQHAFDYFGSSSFFLSQFSLHSKSSAIVFSMKKKVFFPVMLCQPRSCCTRGNFKFTCNAIHKATIAGHFLIRSLRNRKEFRSGRKLVQRESADFVLPTKRAKRGIESTRKDITANNN